MVRTHTLGSHASTRRHALTQVRSDSFVLSLSESSLHRHRIQLARVDVRREAVQEQEDERACEPRSLVAVVEALGAGEPDEVRGGQISQVCVLLIRAAMNPGWAGETAPATAGRLQDTMEAAGITRASVDVVNVAWMLTATVIIFAEKTLALGHRLARPLGTAMAAGGIVLLGRVIAFLVTR
jgi:hypothetical protein